MPESRVRSEGPGATMGKYREALPAAGQGLFVGVAALAGSVALLVLSLLSIALIPLGVGVVTTTGGAGRRAVVR